MVTGNYEEDFEDVTESLYVDDSRQVSSVAPKLCL